MRLPGRHGVAGGWTLVEMLVAVAILAVLVAVTLPALRGVRTSGRDIASLSNLRSHAAVFAAYTVDYRGAYPCITDPRRPASDISCERIVFPDSPYFLAGIAWNVGLADGYYGGDPFQAWFYSPGYVTDWLPDGGHPTWSSYSYSCAFLADPAYWRPETRTGPAQWRATRADEVVFPSKKALFTDIYVYLRRNPEEEWSNRRTLMALVDGAALSVPPRDQLRQYVNGDGDFPGAVHHWSEPGTHTLEGVRGRDLR